MLFRSRHTSQMRSFFAEYILNNSKISDAERVSLGLSPRDKTPTSVVVPTTQPIAKIDFSVRLQHRVSFVDSATPTSRAKPHGVYGCQIWIKIGDNAPVSEDELKFVGTDTASPHLIKLRFRCREAGLLLAAMGKQERRNRTLECTCKRHDRRLTIEQTVNSGQRRERRSAVCERCLKRKIPEITLRDFFVFAGIYPKLRDTLFDIYR